MLNSLPANISMLFNVVLRLTWRYNVVQCQISVDVHHHWNLQCCTMLNHVYLNVDLNNVRQRRNNIIFNVDLHSVEPHQSNVVNMTIKKMKK